MLRSSFESLRKSGRKCCAQADGVPSGFRDRSGDGKPPPYTDMVFRNIFESGRAKLPNEFHGLTAPKVPGDVSGGMKIEGLGVPRPREFA